MAKSIFKPFGLSGSIVILVFTPLASVPNPKWNPFSEGVKYTGVGKFCDIRLKLPFISETVRDRLMIAM